MSHEDSNVYLRREVHIVVNKLTPLHKHVGEEVIISDSVSGHEQ